MNGDWMTYQWHTDGWRWLFERGPKQWNNAACVCLQYYVISTRSKLLSTSSDSVGMSRSSRRQMKSVMQPQRRSRAQPHVPNSHEPARPAVQFPQDIKNLRSRTPTSRPSPYLSHAISKSNPTTTSPTRQNGGGHTCLLHPCPAEQRFSRKSNSRCPGGFACHLYQILETKFSVLLVNFNLPFWNMLNRA